ncbi:hypothetical protein DMP17_44770 [Pseudonocardia sp. TMWB2A]|uniref:hypothetical protein n=1 Tax=Pseudonocardia sp. TMWB2A TaxID=687430 RepID=UPI00307CF6BE
MDQALFLQVGHELVLVVSANAHLRQELPDVALVSRVLHVHQKFVALPVEFRGHHFPLCIIKIGARR